MKSGKKYELFYLFSWLTLELLNYYQFVFEFKLNCRFSNFRLICAPDSSAVNIRVFIVSVLIKKNKTKQNEKGIKLDLK